MKRVTDALYPQGQLLAPESSSDVYAYIAALVVEMQDMEQSPFDLDRKTSEVLGKLKLQHENGSDCKDKTDDLMTLTCLLREDLEDAYNEGNETEARRRGFYSTWRGGPHQCSGMIDTATYENC